MNPGVVFRPIADVVRSIVLTSGTLAPLVTFNSELCTSFTNEMQALHIIDENQVCHHLYSYTETCEDARFEVL
jgi:Rad3-related DNA helicase